jgi:hypothetical protein
MRFPENMTNDIVNNLSSVKYNDYAFSDYIFQHPMNRLLYLRAQHERWLCFGATAY